MEVNKKQLADIFGASIRTIQNWQEQGMPVLMNLSTAPMRSPLCVMHWMHVNPVSQEGE
ncbi:Qin prophage; predicted packaging protein [Escherichia coli]|nr:Qin prophage; predicted packaging protein [Escherichia coli]